MSDAVPMGNLLVNTQEEWTITYSIGGRNVIAPFNEIRLARWACFIQVLRKDAKLNLKGPVIGWSLCEIDLKVCLSPSMPPAH